jgi:16S rRNA (cytosine967-C5)-methyltransferase
MGTYFHSYQNSAVSILTAYKEEEPFAFFIKNYFRKHKKFGSRDRKIISDLCFGYLRIGRSGENLSVAEQILIGFFLTHVVDNGFLLAIRQDWIQYLDEPVEKKIALVREVFPAFEFQHIFPFSSFLSVGIDPATFSIHHLQKPPFFLRVRPGKWKSVTGSLEESGIPFASVGEDALVVRSNIDIEKILRVGIDCIVQDISSQKTAQLLKPVSFLPQSIWDACAGSGGKSIMVSDFYPSASLYVSDIRGDILGELDRRFELAGIHPEKVFCTDLEQSLSAQVAYSNLPPGGVDLIIADVPCSGSGTWGRAPEWLRIFDHELIGEYQKRQIRIVSNLTQHLKPGGYLLYITCSVFKAENEEVVEALCAHSDLKLVGSQLISGIETGGDHLFTVLLQI